MTFLVRGFANFQITKDCLRPSRNLSSKTKYKIILIAAFHLNWTTTLSAQLTVTEWFKRWQEVLRVCKWPTRGKQNKNSYQKFKDLTILFIYLSLSLTTSKSSSFPQRMRNDNIGRSYSNWRNSIEHDHQREDRKFSEKKLCWNKPTSRKFYQTIPKTIAIPRRKMIQRVLYRHKHPKCLRWPCLWWGKQMVIFFLQFFVCFCYVDDH